MVINVVSLTANVMDSMLWRKYYKASTWNLQKMYEAEKYTY
jgi:hypothetical protein